VVGGLSKQMLSQLPHILGVVTLFGSDDSRVELCGDVALQSMWVEHHNIGKASWKILYVGNL
jgi:hypothetical protein